MRLNKAVVVMLGILVLSGCSGPNSGRYSKSHIKKHAADMNHLKKEKNEFDVVEEIIMPESKISKALNIYNQQIDGASEEAGIYQANPMKMIDVSISDRGYTRFSIEGERIEDVFLFPQEAMQISIHRQGYLLVLPQSAMIEAEEEQDIYMTITGEEGTTQDVSLRLTGKAPQPVKFVKVNLE